MTKHTKPSPELNDGDFARRDDLSGRHLGRRAFLSRAVATLAAGATTAGVLAGCGQKGPLYMPDEKDSKKKKKTS